MDKYIVNAYSETKQVISRFNNSKAYEGDPIEDFPTTYLDIEENTTNTPTIYNILNSTWVLSDRETIEQTANALLEEWCCMVNYDTAIVKFAHWMLDCLDRGVSCLKAIKAPDYQT